MLYTCACVALVSALVYASLSPFHMLEGEWYEEVRNNTIISTAHLAGGILALLFGAITVVLTVVGF